MKKVALVTGGGRDIGRGIVERLARTHAAVAIHAHASGRAAADLAGELDAAGVRARAFAADLGKPADIRSMFDAFDAWLGELGADHRLTTLVNNSAVAAPSPLGGTDAAYLDAMVDVNLKGTYRMTDAAASRMADGGRIVSVTLDAHAVFAPEYSLFTATKVAIDALTRHWAVELGGRGITVNAVAPGVVDVNFRTEMLKDPQFRQSLEAATALRRIGRVPDVADVVEFLVGESSRWVTGQALPTSGGWRL